MVMADSRPKSVDTCSIVNDVDSAVRHSESPAGGGVTKGVDPQVGTNDDGISARCP